VTLPGASCCCSLAATPSSPSATGPRPAAAAFAVSPPAASGFFDDVFSETDFPSVGSDQVYVGQQVDAELFIAAVVIV
jgi:hypothetical protein